MPFGLGKARVMTGAIGHLHSVGAPELIIRRHQRGVEALDPTLLLHRPEQANRLVERLDGTLLGPRTGLVQLMNRTRSAMPTSSSCARRPPVARASETL
jgi:hypothetical protein